MKPTVVECNHSWHLGPIVDSFLFARDAVCVKCWLTTRMSFEESIPWPRWTESDYLRYRDKIEGTTFEVKP